MQPFVRKVVNELISLSNAVTSRDKRTNDSKDSIDELINSLSGSHMFSLVMRLSRDERATQTRSCQIRGEVS